ncbi:MAG: hypothetical protein ACQCN6_00345 [Candidatus Bathyarchaeia archaeon]|jgi:hypothetical protein
MNIIRSTLLLSLSVTQTSSTNPITLSNRPSSTPQEKQQQITIIGQATPQLQSADAATPNQDAKRTPPQPHLIIPRHNINIERFSAKSHGTPKPTSR